LALLEAARNSAAKPALAIVSLVFGIGATLAMNVAAGWHHGSAGALVAALPPVALVLSLDDDAVMSAYLHGRDCDGEAPSQRQLAAQFGVSRARVATLVSSLNGTPGTAEELAELTHQT
jgi:hypothetical protein